MRFGVFPKRTTAQRRELAGPWLSGVDRMVSALRFFRYVLQSGPIASAAIVKVLLRIAVFSIAIQPILSARLLAQEELKQASPQKEAMIHPERKTIQEEGTTYVLLSSHRDEHIQTEEYGIEGETASNWTQVITYQRLTLSEALGVNEYVSALKERIEQNGATARVRIVQSGSKAAIFGFEYGRADGTADPAQLGLVLVTLPDKRRPQELELVQYGASPSQLSLDLLAARMKRWQARFEAQAAKQSQN